MRLSSNAACSTSAAHSSRELAGFWQMPVNGQMGEAPTEEKAELLPKDSK
jgi:hypothetical protein